MTKTTNDRKILAAVAAGTAATLASHGAAADPQDFAGFNIGVGVGAIAEALEGDNDTAYAPATQGLGYVFAGYNTVWNQTIVGVEVRAWSDGTYSADGDDYGLSHLVDAMVRVGWEITPGTMVYGALGMFHTEFLFIDSHDGGTASGPAVGAGFETNITQNWYLGADLTVRKPTSVDSDGGDNKLRRPFTSASLRIGFRF